MLNTFILKLLGDYGSDVLVIVTAVLTVLTGFYAFQTKRTVQVMEKAARMEFLPMIKGHLPMKGPVNLDFRISNVGKGPASDVRVNFTVIGRNTVTRTWRQPLLIPNGFQDFFIPISENEEKSDVPYFEDNKTRIEISALYKDILGNEHSSKEEIDISGFVTQFKRTLSVYNKGIIEKNSSNIEKISNHSNTISQGVKEIGNILSDRKHRDLIEFKFRNIYHKLNKLNLRVDSNTELEILICALETELLTYRRNDLLKTILTKIREINTEVNSEIMDELRDIIDRV